MSETMTKDATMSEVLRSVVDRCGYAVLGMEEIDALAVGQPLVMIFLAGNHARQVQSDDVAAVLPELDKALAGHAKVVVASHENERALQRRYHFTSFPTLIFLRDGGYLGAIEGIRDWSDYLVEIPEILGREPHDPPPYRLPAGCGTN